MRSRVFDPETGLARAALVYEVARSLTRSRGF